MLRYDAVETLLAFPGAFIKAVWSKQLVKVKLKPESFQRAGLTFKYIYIWTKK